MKIHFIGIGGIGISGLAQYMHFKGHQVSGSDLNSSLITKKLSAMGIEITTPHSSDAIIDQDLVIHSAIIRPDNPEVIRANELNIKVVARREALLEILKDEKVFAVAGAHGKSTTTAILSAIMQGSAIIGAESKEFGSNVRFNDQTNIMLFEADESDGSFLNSNPYCSLVINAEPEHMEYYDYNTERFYDSYKRFINQAKLRVLNAQDPFLATLKDEVDALWLHPKNDITNINYTLIDDEPYTEFQLKDMGKFQVWGFGEHIAVDASLAIIAANESMDIETIRENLLHFKGIKKRFDIVSKDEKSVIIDDYGHHPTEIKATFDSVKTYAKLKGFKKITAIWQPHKYSRTLTNIETFSTCFEGVDKLIVLPVWSAGEIYQEIDFQKMFQEYDLTLADKITREPNLVNIIKKDKVFETIDSGLIISFGAGDITYQIRGEK
jgi:UDP-N-acetylmuramate--alanine ligase